MKKKKINKIIKRLLDKEIEEKYKKPVVVRGFLKTKKDYGKEKNTEGID